MSNTTVVIARIEVPTEQAETVREALQRLSGDAWKCEARIADDIQDSAVLGAWMLQDSRAGAPDGDLVPRGGDE